MGFSYFDTPGYLQQTTTGLFLFRLQIPRDCVPAIGKSGLKYSLKTKVDVRVVAATNINLKEKVPALESALDCCQQNGLHKNA